MVEKGSHTTLHFYALYVTCLFKLCIALAWWQSWRPKLVAINAIKTLLCWTEYIYTIIILYFRYCCHTCSIPFIRPSMFLQDTHVWMWLRVMWYIICQRNLLPPPSDRCHENILSIHSDTEITFPCEGFRKEQSDSMSLSRLEPKPLR